MSNFNRRTFLAGIGAAGIAATLPRAAIAAPQPEPFSFLFLTDAHLQPELNAAVGTDMAFKHARTMKADFAIQGGDHVFDACAVPKSRSVALFDLYGKTEQDLGLKVYHTLGNHDVLGIAKASGVAPADKLYGRGIFEERFGKTYYSFDHKSCHFVVLDSIGLLGDGEFEGRIDAAQLAWLRADLDALPAHTPIVVVSHIPLVTAYLDYSPPPAKPYAHNYFSVVNAYEVFPLFHGRNVLGVLQGHTHVNETIVWQGVPYITSGAICGNWWRGIHLGTPEGFTVATIAGGKLTTRYDTYGFQSVEPDNT
jgi:3',5'-cyclic AMP phosphodiesterase CpdA